MIRRHRIGYATRNDLAKYFRLRGGDPEIANDHGLSRAVYLVGCATEIWQKAKYPGLPSAPKPLFGVASIRGVAEVFVGEGAFD